MSTTNKAILIDAVICSKVKALLYLKLYDNDIVSQSNGKTWELKSRQEKWQSYSKEHLYFDAL